MRLVSRIITIFDPHLRYRGNALPEYVLPLSLFSVLGMIAVFGNVGQVSLSGFANASNGALNGSSLTISSLGSSLTGGGNPGVSGEMNANTPLQICDQSGQCITLPASVISAIETNGSLGTEDINAISQVLLQLAKDYQQKDPAYSDLLLQLANKGFEVANNMAFIKSLQTSPDPKVIEMANYVKQLQSQGYSNTEMQAQFSQKYNPDDFGNSLLFATSTNSVGSKAGEYKNFATMVSDYMSKTNLLTPGMSTLLDQLSNEVYNTTYESATNLNVMFDPQSETTVRVDSGQIQDMGLTIAPPTSNP